ncbi:phage late control D family protein [Embleya sp. NPDC008237]|uniref:phage late control D family protein n=1 Tax=unclassified Embleya TaxID=2699296 RepID=UPI0036E8779D
MSAFPQYAPEMRLRFAGRPAPAALRGSVTGVTCQTGMGDADRLEISLANEGLRWLDDPLFRLDTEVGIALGYAPDEPRRLFTGEVVGTEASFPSDGMPMLRVVAQDRRTRLATASPARWFGVPVPKLGVFPLPDPVVAPVLAVEHGMIPLLDPLGAFLSAALGVVDVVASAEDPSMRQRVVRRQQSETTLDFLKKIALENAWELIVEHDGEPSGFVLRLMSPAGNLSSDVTLRHGRSLMEFTPRISTVGQVARVSVRVWRPEVRLELTVSVGYDWDRQALTIEVTPGFGLPVAGKAAAREVLLVDEPVTIATAPRLIVSKLLPRLNRRTTASGSCVGDPRISAGRVLRIEGVGETFGGLWRVVSAQHTLDGGGYRTSFDLRKEIWFGAVPPASQGAVRVQGGLLSLPAPNS